MSHAWGIDFGVAITSNPLKNGCLKDTETWDMWRTHDQKNKILETPQLCDIFFWTMPLKTVVSSDMFSW